MHESVKVVAWVIGSDVQPVPELDVYFFGHVDVAENSPVHDVPSVAVTVQPPGWFFTLTIDQYKVVVPFFVTKVGFAVRSPVRLPDGEGVTTGVCGTHEPTEQNCGAVSVVLDATGGLQFASCMVSTMVSFGLLTVVQVHTSVGVHMLSEVRAREKSIQPVFVLPHA